MAASRGRYSSTAVNEPAVLSAAFAGGGARGYCGAACGRRWWRSAVTNAKRLESCAARGAGLMLNSRNTCADHPHSLWRVTQLLLKVLISQERAV